MCHLFQVGVSERVKYNTVQYSTVQYGTWGHGPNLQQSPK
jgi:hypothetical protein